MIELTFLKELMLIKQVNQEVNQKRANLSFNQMSAIGVMIY